MPSLFRLRVLKLFLACIRISYDYDDKSATHTSQVAKGSDLYRVDKSNKLCMVVAKGMLVNIRIGAHS